MFRILLLALILSVLTTIYSFQGIFPQQKIFNGQQLHSRIPRYIHRVHSTTDNENIPKRGEVSVSSSDRAIKIDWDAVLKESNLKQQRIVPQSKETGIKWSTTKKRSAVAKAKEPVVKEPSGLDDDLIDELLRDDDVDLPILNSRAETSSAVATPAPRKVVKKTKKVAELKAMDLYNQLKPYLTSQPSSAAADETINLHIQESFLSPMLRAVDPYKYIFTGVQLYYQWLKSSSIDLLDSKPRKFLVRYVNQCFIDNFTIPATRTMDMLLIDRMAAPSDFLPGRIASSIHQAMTQQQMLNTTKVTSSTVPSVNETISKFKLAIKETVKSNLVATKKPLTIKIEDVNQIIRVLGKYRLINEIFDLLTFIRQLASNTPKFPIRLKPNDETYEFLANAVVANVQQDATARAMKDLPKPDTALPEVILIGRSNVGKSSLVNFLVNRKVGYLFHSLSL
jgi:hypothetical protein